MNGGEYNEKIMFGVVFNWSTMWYDEIKSVSINVRLIEHLFYTSYIRKYFIKVYMQNLSSIFLIYVY